MLFLCVVGFVLAFFSLSLSLPTARVSQRVCSENVRANLDASLSPILYYM